jgi:hypothetical protein
MVDVALALIMLLSALSSPIAGTSSVFGSKEGIKLSLNPSIAAESTPSLPHGTPSMIVDPSQLSTCKLMLLQAHEKVVMGLALSYTWEKIGNFVLTLRTAGYTGSIVLGIGKDASEELKAKLLENCVTGVVVDESVSTITSKGETMPFAAGRFLLFDGWLQQLGLEESAWVLVRSI